MPQLRRQRLFLVVLTLIFTFPALARPASGPRWEKIHVYNTSPTAVFAKLGLTHSTKNGYTRDGKQGVPDPTFPPGLTDIVPYDAEKLLLVRGTPDGLSVFRARVTAADVPSPPLHLHAELSRFGTGQMIGSQDEDRLTDGVPAQVVLGDGARVYQITERANPDGTVWVACRVSLPLPDQSSLTPTGPVFIPERIWADPMSRKVRLGEVAEFNDLVSVREAAARKLGATGTDTGQDYTLRVTLTLNAPQ